MPHPETLAALIAQLLIPRSEPFPSQCAAGISDFQLALEQDVTDRSVGGNASVEHGFHRGSVDYISGSTVRQVASALGDTGLHWPVLFPNRSMSFHNRKNLIDARNDLLRPATRPVNLDLIHFGRGPQSEMKTLVGAGAVAASADDVSTLADPVGSKEDLGADGVPWTLGSPDQFEREPMVAVLHHVAEQSGSGVHVIQNNVDVTVIEEISEDRTSSRHHDGQAAPGRG